MGHACRVLQKSDCNKVKVFVQFQGVVSPTPMRKLFAVLTFVGGALFGLLFATRAGRDFRSDIHKTKDEEVLPKVGKELLDAGKNFVTAVKHTAEGPMEDALKMGKKKGEQFAMAAKKKFNRVRKEAMKKMASVPVLSEYFKKNEMASGFKKKAISKSKRAVKKVMKVVGKKVKRTGKKRRR